MITFRRALMAVSLVSAAAGASSAWAAPKSRFLTPVPVQNPAPAQAKVSVKDAEARARHLQAVELLLVGNTKAALSILRPLASSKLSAEELDRVHITLGRAYYQAGMDSEALEAYQNVRKGSSSWLEALEERSWVHMRLGEPHEALASLKTVLSPLFKERIGSEPYFLASLAQMRVCDYKAMFKTIELFKNRFRDKVRSWEASIDLADKARLREAGESIQKMNLVEAEAIQKLYIDESGKRHSGKAPRIARDRNQLNFPEVEGEEVWLDEVDDFRVTVKGCPQPATVPATMMARKENSEEK